MQEFFEVTNMKIFVSWSGDLSKKFAESIKKWIPCIIQAVDVFFSPDDIEKGENWDSKISKELSECKYGIICLTSENVNAPWINFEAGAIAKALDARVATLMINVNPSDIKGPLSRYQGTKIEKNDFFQLLQDINKQCEPPVNSDVLENIFAGLWDKIESELTEIISTTKTVEKNKKANFSGEVVEEILQLLRKQNSILCSPTTLLPEDYLKYIYENVLKTHQEENYNYIELIEEILQYLMWFISQSESNVDRIIMLRELQIEKLIDILVRHLSSRRQRNRRLYMMAKDLQDRYQFLFAELP